MRRELGSEDANVTLPLSPHLPSGLSLEPASQETAGGEGREGSPRRGAVTDSQHATEGQVKHKSLILLGAS